MTMLQDRGVFALLIDADEKEKIKTPPILSHQNSIQSTL